MKGWKCLNKIRVAFSITLNADRNAVFAKSEDIKRDLLILMEEDPTST
jgi:hypothetical protein